MEMALAHCTCPLAPEAFLAELAAALHRLSAARRSYFTSQLVWDEARDVVRSLSLSAEDHEALKGALEVADAAQRLRYGDDEGDDARAELRGERSGEGGPLANEEEEEEFEEDDARNKDREERRHVLGVDPRALYAAAATRDVPTRATPAARAEVAARLEWRVDTLALLLQPTDDENDDENDDDDKEFHTKTKSSTHKDDDYDDDKDAASTSTRTRSLGSLARAAASRAHDGGGTVTMVSNAWSHAEAVVERAAVAAAAADVLRTLAVRHGGEQAARDEVRADHLASKVGPLHKLKSVGIDP